MNNKEISKYIALSDRQTEFEFTVKNNYDFSLKRQNIPDRGSRRIFGLIL